MGKYLFVFTNSFPFGNGYQWLKNELDIIHSSFEKVHIFPFSYEGKREKVLTPGNTEVHAPVFEDEPNFHDFQYKTRLISSRLSFYLKEFYRESVYSNSYWLKSWLAASVKTEMLLKSPLLTFIKEWQHKEETCLYFYWGINMSLLVPFLKEMGFKRIVVRFHGFDLYKERLGGYQPYRRPLLQNLSLAAPVSDKGRTYLLENYQEETFNVKTCRLGTISKGLALSSEDGVFRIFSCARLIELKRIPLIAEALGCIENYSIIWTHLGDGEEMGELQNKIKELPKNVQVNLVGWVKSDAILDFYVGKKADLFLNVSTTEGVPVSIMEAFSAGIPVLATDVGGTRELVNETNGKLLNPQLDKIELAKEIVAYLELDKEEMLKNRRNAFSTYNSKANSMNLAAEFKNYLIS